MLFCTYILLLPHHKDVVQYMYAVTEHVTSFSPTNVPGGVVALAGFNCVLRIMHRPGNVQEIY